MFGYRRHWAVWLVLNYVTLMFTLGFVCLFVSTTTWRSSLPPPRPGEGARRQRVPCPPAASRALGHVCPPPGSCGMFSEPVTSRCPFCLPRRSPPHPGLAEPNCLFISGDKIPPPTVVNYVTETLTHLAEVSHDGLFGIVLNNSVNVPALHRVSCGGWLCPALMPPELR